MNNNFGVSLGAALIAKDAARNISYAVGSLNQVCKQIVVVDTGSADSTPVICSRLGAEVHSFKWNDSFSEARNYSLKFLRTDWVIILDSDEILDVYSLLRHKDLFMQADIGGIRVKIENHLGDAELAPRSIHKYTRIFRNDSRFRFTGRIHEQIAPSIEETDLKIVDSDIIIRHYGYINPEEEKLNRNIELLKAELNENPHDDWLKYHLAETEFAAANYDEAKRLFEAIDDSKDLSIEQIESVFIRLAQIALRNDNYKEVEKRLDFSSSDINREGFRLFILAASNLMQRKFAEAYELYTAFAVGISTLVDKEQVETALNLLEELAVSF